MGFFDIFRTTDINDGVRRFRETRDAQLLDVRSRQEYISGHIPGSRNLPLHRIEDAQDDISTDVPLFVHCQSGVRSRQAVSILREMGYNEVYDIGGIGNYKGALEV